MPRYIYNCPECNLVTARIVKMDDRDAQVCGTRVPIIYKLPEKYEKELLVTYRQALCKGMLVREEISETAKMGLQWGIR